MKKSLIYLLCCVVVAVLSAVSCKENGTEIDDSQRLDSLREKGKALANDAGMLANLVWVAQRNDELLDFEQISEDGVLTGFKAVLKDAGEIIFNNGKSDIQVGEENGKYYWMSGGEWLTDSEGKKVEIAPENPLPQFSVVDGVLKVSVDVGNSLQPVVNVDKFLITSILEDDTRVVITLSGGADITIKKYKALSLILEGDERSIGAGEGITVTYKIEGTENATIEVLCGTGWEATVTAATPTTGTIEITAPTPIAQDKVTVVLSDEKGNQVEVEMRLTIDESTNQGPVVEGYINVSEERLEFLAAGSSKNLVVTANVPFTYNKSVDWITITEEANESEIILSISVFENDSVEERTAVITFSGENADTKTVDIFQSGQLRSLSVSDHYLLFSQDGGSGSVEVTSNVPYSVTVEDGEWLTVSGTPMTGTRTFQFAASENSTYDERTATVVFDGEGIPAKTLAITQSGKEIVIPRTDGGANLYTYPGSDSHYRYGPSIIVNDDGSLDVWTSKEGGNFLYYGLYAYQETGSRSKKAASGHTFAQYFNIQNKFRAIQVRMYGTGSEADNIVISLYKWAGSYAATLATTPIASRTFANIATGGNYYRTFRSDEAWVDAGEYLWTATEATSGVSVSSFPGAGTSSIIDAVSYVDGVPTDSFNFEMRPRGRTTTNFFSVDRFAYFHSSDGGGSWAKERDVLFGTEGSEDEWSVCDPGAAHFGGWYYLGYTSAPGKYGGTFNSCYLARSRTPAGPWYKWNGSGWGGDPAKVIEFTGATGDWGIGEPSIVVKDNTVYLYYTLTENSVTVTKVMTAPLSENWPANLTDRGVAMDKRALYSSDSADVKYVEDYGLFYAFHTYNRMTSSSKIAVWVSEDGLRFSYIGDMTGSFQPGMHNMGVSGDGEGHIRLSQQQYVSYAYVVTGEWGQWSTWFGPIYFE
jgi:hypothetical protein